MPGLRFNSFRRTVTICFILSLLGFIIAFISTTLDAVNLHQVSTYIGCFGPPNYEIYGTGSQVCTIPESNTAHQCICWHTTTSKCEKLILSSGDDCSKINSKYVVILGTVTVCGCVSLICLIVYMCCLYAEIRSGQQTVSPYSASTGAQYDRELDSELPQTHAATHHSAPADNGRNAFSSANTHTDNVHNHTQNHDTTAVPVAVAVATVKPKTIYDDPNW